MRYINPRFTYLLTYFSSARLLYFTLLENYGVGESVRVNMCVRKKVVGEYRSSSELRLRAMGTSPAIWDHTVLTATRHK